MVTKQGKQASRKAAARKYGFLEVPLTNLLSEHLIHVTGTVTRPSFYQEH
ncbi:MAG: hypothetical protein Q8K59_07470 [Nitrosomonas sp.]|nr:hypothetical protein [Nitrosomonas sp.]MDP1950917.1 hypothetical protein [Nitrosomonas sp.]